MAQATRSTSRLRWALWLSTLGATVLAVLYPMDKADMPIAAAVVPARSAANRGAESVPGNGTADVGLTTAMQTGEDPFSKRNWQPTQAPVAPAPVAPVVVAQPPAPVVPSGPPALPFKFAGQIQDGGQTVVYLAMGDQALVAQVGATLDQRYKVLEVDAKHVLLEYLPTGDKQTLAFTAIE